jgi:hypothetical protein
LQKLIYIYYTLEVFSFIVKSPSHIIIMDAAFEYTHAKIAFAVYADSNPVSALWSYLTNSGPYAQLKAAEQAFNDERARAQSNTVRYTM